MITLHHGAIVNGQEVGTVALRYGMFINTVIEFIIVAFSVFLVIKQINRLKRPEAPPPPSTKDCPFCLEHIPLKATRCGHCISDLPA
jgi:large conductance mechanosensitive channel